MITKMTGTLTRVLDDEARLAVGPLEYQVLVPEAVRRHLQLRTGQEVTFHVSEYLEGNPSGNRFIPRRVGFLHELELEFFDLFCTVEKIGVKKALKAMARPVREIADAINRQDTRWLSTLPGIGATTAEQIVMTLKRKVPKFLIGSSPEAELEPVVAETKPTSKRKPPPSAPEPVVESAFPEGRIVEDVYEALMALGLSPVEARSKLDGLLTGKRTFKTVEDALMLVYSRG